MDSKHIVNLSGRDFCLYAGVLAEAHERGLQSIETTIVQVPTDDNGKIAIVKARVTLKDGTVFEELGDASPENVNQKARLHLALLRMAATRAKGRALRDAINVSVTMAEELPDMDDAPAPARTNGHQTPHAAARAREAAAGGSTPGTPPAKTGFEPHYSEAGTRHWTRVELIEEVRLLLGKALTLGIEKPAKDLEAVQNGRLLAMVTTLRQEIDAKTAAPAGAEGV